MNEKDKLLEIKYIIEDCLTKRFILDEFLYHHNVSYHDTPSVIKNGILSLREQNIRGITNYSEETLKKLDDTESHINGIDGISLSVVGLKDLMKDEEEYNPFNSRCVDIVISMDVKASRNSSHYGNEYIADKIILPEKIKSIDIRLLSYIQELLKKENVSMKDMGSLIEKYNNLMEIASEVLSTEYLIPIREMSSDSVLMDPHKLLRIPKF